MIWIPPAPYTQLNIEGFPIKVDSAYVSKNPEQWQNVRRELTNQLFRITRVIPAPALQKLRQVTIWVHEKSPETACMAYHPGAQWLREHSMNPDMEKGIELGNGTNFLSWTQQQPWMVLHEMAHAYHDRFLPSGFANPDIAEEHRKAIADQRYESVLHWNGTKTKHYAATNPMEFFAEATEAYFGQNDFFPFVNAELKTTEPTTFTLIERLWKNP